MKHTIRVKDFVLGKGTVKICVPVLASTISAIEQQCQIIQDLPCELVEIRMDYFSSLDHRFLKDAFLLIRKLLPKKALLATFRSYEEGGQISCSDAAYRETYRFLMENQFCDLIDIEASRKAELIAEMQKIAHKNNIYTILSHHDFEKTPSYEELLAQLQTMSDCLPNIVKLAVMPQREEDVEHLMKATKVMHQRVDQLFITMAMGALGQRTRLEGEVFGSCVTFACAEQASAPGQLPCKEVRKRLDEVHKQIIHQKA